jgi:alkylation response protein AidB-like acyl-CoA dehydrogenase
LQRRLDYLRIRTQFGRPVGSIQALQYRAVNMYIRTEDNAFAVASVAANDDPYRIGPALAIAVKARHRSRRCSCIPFHGVTGLTDEHDIGLYLKRTILLSFLFGNAAA